MQKFYELFNYYNVNRHDKYEIDLYLNNKVAVSKMMEDMEERKGDFMLEIDEIFTICKFNHNLGIYIIDTYPDSFEINKMYDMCPNNGMDVLEYEERTGRDYYCDCGYTTLLRYFFNDREITKLLLTNKNISFVNKTEEILSSRESDNVIMFCNFLHTLRTYSDSDVELFKLFLKTNIADCFHKRPLLHYIVDTNNLNLLKLFFKLQDNININEKDQYGITPLMLVYEISESETFDFLLQNGAKTPKIKTEDVRLLKYDEYDERVCLMLKYIDDDFDVNKDYSSEGSILSYLCSNNIKEEFDLLLKHKDIDLYKMNKYGYTPLVNSCKNTWFLQKMMKHETFDINRSVCKNDKSLLYHFLRKYKDTESHIKLIEEILSYPSTIVEDCVLSLVCDLHTNLLDIFLKRDDLNIDVHHCEKLQKETDILKIKKYFKKSKLDVIEEKFQLPNELSWKIITYLC